jgi:hypothetical protein
MREILDIVEMLELFVRQDTFRECKQVMWQLYRDKPETASERFKYKCLT